MPSMYVQATSVTKNTATFKSILYGMGIEAREVLKPKGVLF